MRAGKVVTGASTITRGFPDPIHKTHDEADDLRPGLRRHLMDRAQITADLKEFALIVRFLSFNVQHQTPNMWTVTT
jgi:hypothetical protein